MKSKILIFFLSIMTAASVITLGLFQNNVKAGEVNNKVNTIDEFLLGSWVSLYSDANNNISEQSLRDQIDDISDSGMNLLFNCNSKGHYVGYSNEEINEICAQNNIGFMAPSQTAYTAEEMEQLLFYYMKDEPSAAHFQSVADSYHERMAADTTRAPFVNLYPNYAGTSNLGGTYDDYVRGWVNTVGADNLEYLYFDHYPFTQYENVRASYFSDVETIRKVAYENGRIKTGGFTQMGWWNGMRKPTVDEARWSTYSLLSYGMKSISHFCWVSPKYVSTAEGGEGMMDFVLDADGNKTELYEPMQKINWQIRQLGNYMMNLDCAHAYHTGTVPEGTEALPKSFVLMPQDKSQELTISLFTSKDDGEKYIMVFNKSTENSVTANFNIDSTSGVEGITYIKPDDFNTLPDKLKQLNAPTNVTMNIANGVLTDTLKAGEAKLYKLDGSNVTIPQPISIPLASLKSGIHNGQQTVAITTSDINTNIYYTLDGSYPTIYSNQYIAPIVLGKNGEISRHTLRYLAVRGEEVSALSEYDYFITDDTQNVAYKKNVVIDGGAQPFNCTDGTAALINDGFNDAWHAVSTRTGTLGFATIDFGKNYYINKIFHAAWNNWAFKDVIIQLSTTPTFDEGTVYTVYNNDSDNSVGCGSGVNEQYIEIADSGHVYKFEPVISRYLRCYNESAQNSTKLSIWTEVMAFTAYDSGTDISLNGTQWQMTGGGNWNITDGVIKQTSVYNESSWDRSYTYKTAKLKNFMLEGIFKINNYSGGQNGFFGFGLYKPTVSATQSSNGAGFYVGIEPKGRVFVYNGSGGGEIGPRNIEAIGFNVNNEFRLRVITIDNVISIYVDGKQVFYLEDDALNRDAGYISIQGGPFELNVSDLRLTDMSNYAVSKFQEIIESVETIEKIAVEKYTLASEIISKLPKTLQIKDSKGKSSEATVIWDKDSYDRKITGWYTFKGELSELNNNIKNLYNVYAEQKVFVKGDVDKTEFHKLIAQAKSLNQVDFTLNSWEQLTIKLNAALDMDSNPFMVQNDIGVGLFQLFDAIHALESVVDKTALQNAVSQAELLISTNYTEKSFNAFNVQLLKAKEKLNDNLSNQAAINSEIAMLNSATNALVLKADKGSLTQLIGEVKLLSSEKYTGLSFAILQNSLATAELLVSFEAISQSEIDNAVLMLNSAKTGLVEKTDTTIITDKGCNSSSPFSALMISAALLAVLLIKNKK